MTKKIVLTGGPGTGKSSILLALEAQGEYVIREAAEDCIKLRQAQGQLEPWLEENFQERILELQLQREARIPKKAERAFLDRSIIDGLAYAKPGTRIYEKTLEKAKEQDYHNMVFLIGSLGRTETNAIRRENNAEAQELGRKLEEVYENLGYRIFKIGADTIEQRMNWITEELGTRYAISA